MRILIDTHEKLASALQKNIPEIDFALIFGSAAGGALKKSSDIDVGVYLNTPATEDLILEIVETVESIMHAECDLSILNDASEILRFEALKGRLLFVREDRMQEYASFYSITCREYEDAVIWMKKQLACRGYAQ